MKPIYYRLSQQEVDEMRKLNIQEGIQKAHDQELRFLRTLRNQELIIHSYKPESCDCLICKRIEVLEKE